MKSICLSLFFAAGLVSGQNGTLRLLPGSVELNGPEASQQLIAQLQTETTNKDMTREAIWNSSDASVVTISATGALKPVGDGKAIVTAKAEGFSANTTVVVSNSKIASTWSFRNHVIPVLTKAGCNQGACHGALAGKGGFKLTLRGYDPELDYDTLTRQSIGRRISLADPAASLLLRKPTMMTPHGGGLRFKPDSLEYRILAEWIAAGTPPPAPKDKDVASLEVFPKSSLLAPGATQQLVVRAKYTDGSSADVTRWVKYNSNNEGVAAVDDSGLVKINGNGEAAITLWYSSRVLYATMTSPFPNQVSEAVYSKSPRNNYIDEFVLAKLKSLKVEPSAGISDSAFIRRAFLDAMGVLPTVEEVEQFLADTQPDKRKALIDSLLKRDEYVDYWTYKWSDLMLVSSRKLRPTATRAFYDWIREGVQQNKPWDQFAREIFSATGSSRENGALNYFVLHKDPIQLTENVTQAFLGQRLTCARCHNHPLEKWTQKQYYQMANLFSRVGIKNGNDPSEFIIYPKATGDINHPRLLRPMAPTPLDGESMKLEDTNDRRVHFAKWLTSPDNQYFARSIVNRVWGNFMGRGLVDPIDDVRATNPASNEELFAAVTKDFIAHKFDIQHLIRTIMNSAAYQRSAEANGTNKDDNTYYSKFVVRRMPAEVLLDTMSQVTGVATPFSGFPAGTRALQLPDSQVASQFLSVFGRPARVICDASERSSDPSISQALHVVNGDTLNKKLSAADGYVSLVLKLGLSDTRILEHLTLSAFSRYPNEQEKKDWSDMLASARLTNGTVEQRREARKLALEDLMWAMLTSKEFIFNH